MPVPRSQCVSPVQSASTLQVAGLHFPDLHAAPPGQSLSSEQLGRQAPLSHVGEGAVYLAKTMSSLLFRIAHDGGGGSGIVAGGLSTSAWTCSVGGGSELHPVSQVDIAAHSQPRIAIRVRPHPADTCRSFPYVQLRSDLAIVASRLARRASEMHGPSQIHMNEVNVTLLRGLISRGLISQR